MRGIWNMIIFLYVFQLCLIVFYALPLATTDNSETWQLFLSPSNWSSSDLVVGLAGVLAVSGAIGIGLYILFRSDIILLFSLFTWLLSLGSVPIINLYVFVTNEVSSLACPVITESCAVAQYAGILSAGVVSIIYVALAITWWTARE